MYSDENNIEMKEIKKSEKSGISEGKDSATTAEVPVPAEDEVSRLTKSALDIVIKSGHFGLKDSLNLRMTSRSLKRIVDGTLFFQTAVFNNALKNVRPREFPKAEVVERSPSFYRAIINKDIVLLKKYLKEFFVMMLNNLVDDPVIVCRLVEISTEMNLMPEDFTSLGNEVVMLFRFLTRPIKYSSGENENLTLKSISGLMARGYTEKQCKDMEKSIRETFKFLRNDGEYKKDLIYKNLSGADLYRANFGSSNLCGANLKEANLEEATFYSKGAIYGANLTAANLSGAKLKRTNLTSVNLTGANLSGAHLDQVNFESSNLCGANLKEAKLTGGAYLATANLRGANLAGANLYCAYLPEANLIRAALERANLRGANLVRANLVRANLEGANLEGANLSSANLEGANLEGANLSSANLEGAYLTRANLARANLYGAYLAYANLVEANLSSANLTKANLKMAKLVQTNFEGADLSDAILFVVYTIGDFIDEIEKLVSKNLARILPVLLAIRKKNLDEINSEHVGHLKSLGYACLIRVLANIKSVEALYKLFNQVIAKDNIFRRDTYGEVLRLIANTYLCRSLSCEAEDVEKDFRKKLVKEIRKLRDFISFFKGDEWTELLDKMNKAELKSNQSFNSRPRMNQM